MRHTVITTSRWTEWWNVIANKESIQINEHILAKKTQKTKKHRIKCSVLWLLHSFHLSFQAALF